MKKLFCFLAVASTALFTSCSDDDSGDNNTNPNPPVTEVTAITVSSNHSSIELGNAVTFTTKDQAGNTLTQGVTYTIADAAISNPWTPTTAGTFTVVAKYAELTAQVNITVTEEVVEPVTPSDSFVIDNVNYETEVALFGYQGISETAEGSGEYMIGWDFNPFLEEGTGENATYPNDLYITIVQSITPTGTNEQGQPTFTIAAPATGTYTWTSETLPAIFDLWIVADNDALLPEDGAARAAAIEEVTLNIESLVVGNETTPTTLSATYTVTLTDGTVIEGEYSGDSGFYGLPQGRNSNISLGQVRNTSVKNSAFRK